MTGCRCFSTARRGSQIGNRESTMKFKYSIPMLAAILFFSMTRTTSANEMQRLIFNAAGNIGVAAAAIEILGVIPGNSQTINNSINLAITQLNQIAGMYQDPPFEVDAITVLPPKLQRFPQATDRMNNAHKASYLNGVYSNLKSAMTLAYNSRRGTYYCATCDTFVAELGHFLARALTANQLGDAQKESAARSRVNLAISEGIKASGALGCGFPSWDQWQQLGIRNARTVADWARIIQGAENLIASAAGLSANVLVPSSTPPQARHDLVGTYAPNNQFTYTITLENGKLVGRHVKAFRPISPARDNVIFILNAVPEDGRFIAGNASGVAYRGKWRWSIDAPSFKDCFAYVDHDLTNEEREKWSFKLRICTMSMEVGLMGLGGVPRKKPQIVIELVNFEFVRLPVLPAGNCNEIAMRIYEFYYPG